MTGARERVGDLLRDEASNVVYQILDVLGYGTYGYIYLAKTTGPGPVEYKAVKALSKQGLTSSQLLLQRQEIDIHLSLSSPNHNSHPHIVDMASVIETKDSLYLVMEYCSGGDLYDAITSQHAAASDSGVGFCPLPNLSGRALNVHSDASVLDAMAQIISALAHAHMNKVFHRDLKPENILVASDGSLKLADFGLATKAQVSSDFGCGSSFYMAPEQQPASRLAANGSLSTTGRRPYLPAKSDVWSLGIIFLNLRFGRNPWKLSRADADPTFAAYAQDPSVLADMFPELSPSALHFLHRVLCVDPNDRADVFEALELVQNIDTILRPGSDSKDFASMEDCDEERVQSELDSLNSSVASSSSGSSSLDAESETMFHMEDDYGRSVVTAKGTSPSIKTFSWSSSWSSTDSMGAKAWSDMADEEEMDFSAPVQFDENAQTVALPQDSASMFTQAGFTTLTDLMLTMPASYEVL
ncbi:hypothetical protein BGZ94_006380 [Podila epigama]|nr:hypothetical protein BGZ94_006380 [Podila epigama]